MRLSQDLLNQMQSKHAALPLEAKHHRILAVTVAK
jgi:hypothetical protein